VREWCPLAPDFVYRIQILLYTRQSYSTYTHHSAVRLLCKLSRSQSVRACTRSTTWRWASFAPHSPGEASIEPRPQSSLTCAIDPPGRFYASFCLFGQICESRRWGTARACPAATLSLGRVRPGNQVDFLTFHTSNVASEPSGRSRGQRDDLPAGM